jgi:hypothetical protein
MTTTSHLTTVGRVARFSLVAATLLPMLYVITSTAGLVGQLGLDRGLVTTIVNLLVSAGPDVVASVFPFLAPFVGVIKWLLQFGTQAVISF